MFTKVANICPPTGVSLLAQNSEYSYLIFVISFTQAALSNSKFYTQKFTKNTPKHSKMSLKSKIYAVFCVQSGKFYTLENIFTRAPPMVPVTIIRYVENQIQYNTCDKLDTFTVLFREWRCPLSPCLVWWAMFSPSSFFARQGLI